MRMINRLRRGMAIPTVLLVLSVLVVIITAVFEVGFQTHFLTGVQHESQQSLYAAEAGVNQSFREIIAGTNGWNGYRDKAFGLQSKFSVEVFKGPMVVPNGPTIPANTAYLLATGTTRDRYPRQVGVLIQATAGSTLSSPFAFALAAGHDVAISGGGSVNGSVKTSGSINLGGGIRINPYQGSGRMLAGDNINLGGGNKWDDSQDLRARNTIQKGSRTLGSDPANLIFPGDTTPDSQPFIADGRFTNTLSGSETGYIMPNPDPQTLLGLTSDGAGGYLKDALGAYIMNPARTDVVIHSEVDISGTMNLGDKIHFYPNGVTIRGDFSGQGSIVTGDGNPIVVESSVRGARVNLLALSWPSQPKSGDITFQRNVDITGMIYAHGKVYLDNNIDLLGMIIAYSGDITESGGHRNITYDPGGFLLPGFDSWRNVAPPPGPGTATGIPSGRPIQVLSWQRI